MATASEIRGVLVFLKEFAEVMGDDWTDVYIVSPSSAILDDLEEDGLIETNVLGLWRITPNGVTSLERLGAD